MRHWKVERSWAAEPASSDAGYAHTYLVAAVRGSEDDLIELTIAFDEAGSPAEAMPILRPFLERADRPPRRVLVRHDGSAAVTHD